MKIKHFNMDFLILKGYISTNIELKMIILIIYYIILF